jgi:Ni2+-binding GTPase involved in maturation of urease and hydrogenase
MERTRLLMIGGFLGAGKTTVIARLARHYTLQGLRVGLVTNDQAYGLVDTHTLRAQGFHVGEVPGACFCCKFDDLVDTVAKLGADGQPDVILTEPVGSCTDLMATVVQPLRHLYGDRYDLGPLAVLCKPEHGRKILGGGTGGFSPQAAYIFLKQLEEAQLIVLNKIDRLSPAEQVELLDLLQQRFPGKQVLAASATTGAGFSEVVAALEADCPPDVAPMDVDYDTYAQGEAALGWLNASVHFSNADGNQEPWSLDELAKRLVSQLSSALCEADMEPGHVKVLASADRDTAVANWVASDAPVELSVASGANVLAADVLVNVRVHGDPDTLAEIVEKAVEQIAQQTCLACDLSSVQHFRPGRPVPIHRYATPEG